MFYFAYGSNMSIKRLTQRIPSVKLCIGRLSEHRLVFHKRSKDGSAKCDAYYTGNKNDYVIGALFKIDKSKKKDLDKAEGLGCGYEQKEVEIQTDSGKQKAVLYYATDIDRNLKPYSWYKTHVVVGAKENSLPKEYIALIEAVDSIPDPDKKRKKKELNIYR